MPRPEEPCAHDGVTRPSFFRLATLRRKAMASYSDAWPGWCSTHLLIAVAFLILFRLAIKWNGRPSLPPGPQGLPLLGYLPFLRPDLHRCFADLAQSYGPVMRLWLGLRLCVVITSPEAAREVLKDQDAVLANRARTAAVRAAIFAARDIVWTDSSNPRWRALRKAVVRELLNSKSLDNIYDLRRREVRHMAAELYHKAGKPVEIGQVVFEASLKVITAMLWGGLGNGLEQERLVGEFREVVEGIVELLGATNLSDFFPWIAWLDVQGIERRMKGFTTRADSILSKIIEERVRHNKEGCGISEERSTKDLLEMMLELLENGHEPLTVDDVKGLFVDFVLGGTDTTSAISEWVMAEMMCKPETIKRVQEELDMVVGTNKVVEESHIPRLHYLEAVFKEALRLHPPVPLLVPHCPSTPCTIGGYTIPKGIQVFINAWAIHRDPSVWDDPLEFRPERFLMGAQKWDYYGVNNFNFIPFGSGRRTCVGIPLAERMGKFMLATMLHLFNWQIQEEDFELSERFGIVLKKAKPLTAIPTPRFSDQQFYK